MTKVIKTTIEEQQVKKDLLFPGLTGEERFDITRRMRERMKKSNVYYCFSGMDVKITKFY